MARFLQTMKTQGEGGRGGRQGGPYLLPNLCLVPSRKHFQVRGQGAGLQDAAVLGLIEGLPKQDVVSQRGVLDPGLLGYVGHRALEERRRKRRGGEGRERGERGGEGGRRRGEDDDGR